MPHDTLTTNDLYYGAYLLVTGNQLAHVSIKNNGKKKMAVFSFDGPTVQQSSAEYISGTATANVNQLRASIDHLKRLVYEKTSTY
jgi:hypothetical protein